MKKVLIIAYRFPPQGGGGVQRTVKFVKYLRRFGWSPVVHTVDNPFWPLRDETLLREIPGEVRVYRTRTFEFERLEKQLSGVFARRNGKGTRTPGRAETGSHDTQGPGGNKGLLSALRRMVHHRVLMPDPQIAWLPGALVKSLYIAQREAPTLIYTSSPPNSSQVLGLWLKRISGRPWVADFRDPWTDGVRRKQSYVNNPLRQRLEEYWERAVAEHADHLIVTTEKNREQFLAKYPFLGSKMTVLTNGFDPEDFGHLSPERRHLSAGKFNLTLTGNVETMFDATPFFLAVKELLAESSETRSHLQVNFVGTRMGKYRRWIEQNDLGRHIRSVDYVPHADSVQYLAESDVLFFCQIPEHESAAVKLPGKLFEYLYMRKPIFALTLPGVTSELLTGAGLGIVANPRDRQGIKKAISDLYDQWRTKQWRVIPDDAFIRQYDRVRLTERLAEIFVDVMRCRDSVTSKSHVCRN